MGSAPLTCLARTRRVAHRATATGEASKIAITIWLLAVAARLILINQPYVDYWSWRQSDVATIARNFFEHDFRFGYPQIDWAGGSAGYVGTEFPILPFLAAICYKFAGIHEWIGRSQSVIFFAVSLPFFFLLVRDTWHGLQGHEESAAAFAETSLRAKLRRVERLRRAKGCRCHVAAIWATFFYAFAPLNVFAGRSFMPDVPSLSLAIIGLYFFLHWTEHGASLCAPSPESFRGWTNTGQNIRWAHRLEGYVPFFASSITISLSLLIKITSIVIAAPLAFILVGRLCQPRKPSGFTVKRPTIYRAIAFTGIAILPSLAWYWHAYQIAEKFYPHHFFGAGGVRLESLSWYWNIARQTATSSFTPVLTVLALIGLFVAPRGKYGCLFDWWLAAMVLFVVAVGYGNRHPWYQLPFVPIAAAFAGAACSCLGPKISSRVAAVASSGLLASLFAILAFLYVRPLYESSAAPLRDAGLELNKLTRRDALVVAADNGNPAIFYYAKRKGWHFLEKDGIFNGNPRDSQQAIADLERLHRQGATHVVFTRNTFWWLESYPGLTQHLSGSATVLEATPEFKIYRLDAVAR